MLPVHVAPSIIGLRVKQCTGVPTFTTNHRNKNVNADRIKHIFIVLILTTKSVFKHLKHTYIIIVCGYTMEVSFDTDAVKKLIGSFYS